MTEVALDRLHEKCGVVGVILEGNNAAEIALRGLRASKNRGQDAAGVSWINGSEIFVKTGPGLVNQVFSHDYFNGVRSQTASGQVRYATSGEIVPSLNQPFFTPEAGFTMGHNGNLPDLSHLLKFLSFHFSLDHLNSRNDSGLMYDRIYTERRQGQTLPNAVKKAYPDFAGAFSNIIVGNDNDGEQMLIGFRDWCGIRPLSIGKLPNGWAMASETYALEEMGANIYDIDDIKPGEMVIATRNNLRKEQIRPGQQQLCSMESIYFAREESYLLNRLVRDIRVDYGAYLAREHPFGMDKPEMVVSVPASANPAAEGFAEVARLPLVEAIRKVENYRTFITNDGERQKAVKEKYEIKRSLIRGKRLVLVDDSLVRGTNMQHLIPELLAAGADRVDLMIACPPHRFPNYQGIALPDSLIAEGRESWQIARLLNANSLSYLSLNGLLEATGSDQLDTSCFDGNYPKIIEDFIQKMREPVYA